MAGKGQGDDVARAASAAKPPADKPMEVEARSYKSRTEAVPQFSSFGQSAFDQPFAAKSASAQPNLAPDGGARLEALPPLGKEVPELFQLTVGPGPMTTGFAPQAEEEEQLDLLLDFEEPDLLVEEEEGVQPLPTTVVPHQCVTVGASPDAVLAAVDELVLRAAEEVELEARPAQVFSVKGTVVQEHTTAGFAIDLYEHEQGTAVEFRRTHGDATAWHSFFVAMAVQCKKVWPEAAMLGGWSGSYPAGAEEAEEAPLQPFQPTPLDDAAVDSVLVDLAQHSEFSGEAIAELASSVDARKVGAELAAANVQALLQHKHALEVMITHVLKFKLDEPVLRGALFVLHRCCEDAVEQQRRFVQKPLEIMVKLVDLLDGASDIVVQNTVRLLSRLSPAVDAKTRWFAEGKGATDQKLAATVERACRTMAKYAGRDGAPVTRDMLDTVRRLAGGA